MLDDSKELEGRRVLVVEDEPMVAIDYCDRLAAAGAEIVGPFTSVAQALASLEQGRVDVAVLDYALADRNSEGLQSALDARNIPFVIITGYPRVLGAARRAPERAVEARFARRPMFGHPRRLPLSCSAPSPAKD